jgi:hypothetical protein
VIIDQDEVLIPSINHQNMKLKIDHQNVFVLRILVRVEKNLLLENNQYLDSDLVNLDKKFFKNTFNKFNYSYLLIENHVLLSVLMKVQQMDAIGQQILDVFLLA